MWYKGHLKGCPLYFYEKLFTNFYSAYRLLGHSGI